MKISMIAGIGKNNELGKKNKLLWNMPADMAHFKEKTSGHAVIMGQKTFESIGKPLPNRRNVVLTRDKSFKAEGVEIAYSFEEAFSLFKNSSRASTDTARHDSAESEIFIIGGAEIYKQGMAFADKLYITHIEAEDKDADVFFPEIIPIVFGETTRETHKADEKNPYDYSFVEYERF
ncbi:MAG: dihydrofolate reductase [Candidatus Nomurabacteria bacterium]|nr:dihydrofolate reductase [Candidatus Nomurabacteria bacterium]